MIKPLPVALIAMLVIAPVIAADELPPLPPVPVVNTPAHARWCDGLHKAGLTLFGEAILARSDGKRLHRPEADIKLVEEGLAAQAAAVMMAEKAEGCLRSPAP